MIEHERNEEAASILCFRLSAPDERRAGLRIVALWRRQTECLRWIASQAVGRGGWRNDELQRIALAGAHGLDWRAYRDEIVAKRQAERRRPPGQLPRG